jgi:hypothetical protein
MLILRLPIAFSAAIMLVIGFSSFQKVGPSIPQLWKKKELLTSRRWIGLVQDIWMDNMRHASFWSRIIVYNLHLVEFNFFSQIEKTKRIATNAMRVAWTEISAIDAFSRRFVVSILKNPKVALLDDSRWEMRDQDGARVGKWTP